MGGGGGGEEGEKRGKEGGREGGRGNISTLLDTERFLTLSPTYRPMATSAGGLRSTVMLLPFTMDTVSTSKV